ncbi:MAG: hypothetical protein JKY48_19730 [Flavobacteriales bacterium]|nr:hypothetical protein [Flavobacteriales bacterium]
MSKIFIRNRSKKAKVDSNSGKVIDLPEAECVSDDLDHFEFIFNDFLMKGGHELILQASNKNKDKGKDEADFKIYWHETKKEVDGDLFYIGGHCRNLFTVDEVGWGASHSKMQECPDFEDSNTNEASIFCASLASELILTGKSKHPQPKLRDITDLPNDYLFVPLQTEGDYVLKQHSPISIMEFIRTVSEWAMARNQSLVFKHHPSGKFLLPDSMELVKNYVQKSKGLIREFDENVHTLLSRSKGTLLINSGVGFESLIHGIPVATFGDCDYKWATFQTNSENLDQAREYLYNYTQSEKESAWKFVHYYYTQHAYDFRTPHLEKSKLRLENYLNTFFNKKLVPLNNENLLVNG